MRHLLATLPLIESPIMIDGTSQPGWVPKAKTGVRVRFPVKRTLTPVLSAFTSHRPNGVA